ncbi:MAG: SDR family oxidoreductase [bacterium]|nr:SDR family oxidoreductase [bacterium]
MEQVFIVGCGDIGRRVAAIEKGNGSRVTGLARSEESAERLRSAGIEPVGGDLDDPNSLIDLPTGGTVLYYFAPPPAFGVKDPRMGSFLDSLTTNAVPARVVLISTTGVYGDCQGAWITEEQPPRPGSDRARRRLSAERRLESRAARLKLPYVILRVPGIYGPGRLPLDRLRRGEPVVREEEAPFTNRIHADDLARVCVAASRQGGSGRVYNVSDGQPSTMTDYFYRVADFLGLPKPPAISMEAARERLSPGMLSYLMESRRLDNRRMREELGIQLVYPDLETGLRAIVESGS